MNFIYKSHPLLVECMKPMCYQNCLARSLSQWLSVIEIIIPYEWWTRTGKGTCLMPDPTNTSPGDRPSNWLTDKGSGRPALWVQQIQHVFHRFQLYIVIDHFFSELSLALNKVSCDWQDRHSTRENSRWATHLSQTRYTPLVEVNQAIKAWSF